MNDLIDPTFGPDEIATLAALPTPGDTQPQDMPVAAEVEWQQPLDLPKPYWLK